MTIFYIDLIILIILALAGFVDERERRIPNKLLFPILLLSLAKYLLIKDFSTRDFFYKILFSALILAGGTIFCLYRPRSIGMGDIKLISLLILYMGPEEGGLIIWLALLITLIRALINTIIMRFKGGKAERQYPLAAQAALALAFNFYIKYRYLLNFL